LTNHQTTPSILMKQQTLSFFKRKREDSEPVIELNTSKKTKDDIPKPSSPITPPKPTKTLEKEKPEKNVEKKEVPAKKTPAKKKKRVKVPIAGSGLKMPIDLMGRKDVQGLRISMRELFSFLPANIAP
jgi:hypothetical protein